MRIIYQSQAKKYEVPKEKFDELLVDLENAIKTESNRVKAYAGMHLRTPNASKPTGYDVDSLKMARASAKYTGIESLLGGDIKVWTEAVPFENGRFLLGILSVVDYATLRLEDNIAVIEMTKQKGLASNPAVLEKILDRYSK